MSGGPLVGVKVLEFEGIGPVPYAGTLLADMGADIIRISRASGSEWPQLPIVSRGRAPLTLDLKQPSDMEICVAAMDKADVLIEGFRPGVMERLGLGPDIALARNPRLIYGRVTGWGQEGPLAHVAGHDINYLALSGALATLGPASLPPTPPLNLLGDYAGGSLFLVNGILAGLFERERSGLGQVIDAAIVDGAASMMGPLLGMVEAGLLTLSREGNMLGGSNAPYYRTYRCADDQFIALGPLEARFRDRLLKALGLAPGELGDPTNASTWDSATERMQAIFLTRSRDDWSREFESADVCLTAVLSLSEAPSHPHLAARATYVKADGLVQPGTAPRFSRSQASLPTTPNAKHAGIQALRRWGAHPPGSAPGSQV